MTTSHKTKWREARMKVQTDYCLWVPLYSNIENRWASECGRSIVFLYKTPDVNEYKFCPYCGKPLKQEQR